MSEVYLICPVCGIHFARCTNKKYCSPACALKGYKRPRTEKICTYCGNSFSVPFKHKEQAMCSKRCTGLSRRKGCVSPAGYSLVETDNGRRYEHRHVMEQHLGRPLLRSEVVHHLDGNRLNNDISNLQLLSSHSEHRRVHYPRHMSETDAECLMCNTIKPHPDFEKWKGQPISRCKPCKAAFRKMRVTLLQQDQKATH